MMGPAILVGLLLGTVIGLLLGLMIAYLNFSDWVVTYAVMGICSGVALAISDGNTISIASRNFRLLSSGKFLGIYIMIWLAIALCVIMVYLSTKTTFGYNAVSYTHLMSYEVIQQEQFTVAEMAALIDHSLLVPYASRSDLDRFIADVFKYGSVSYTHLDVYKRQCWRSFIRCLTRWRPRCGCVCIWTTVRFRLN